MGNRGVAFLESNLDRPVVNRTGLTGMFDVHLEFFPPESAAADTPGAGASIFTAIEEQLGLKLEATKGPYNVLVVDSIERPTEN